MKQNLNRAFNQQNPPTDKELTDFVLAAGDGKNAAVNDFLDKYPDAIDTPGGEDHFYVLRTALMQAAENASVDTVKLLLNRGANINAANVEGQTALYHAARSGKTEIVKALLSHGANIHDQNDS